MTKCDLLIRNIAVMTDYETIKTGMDIAVEEGRILSVTKSGTEEFQTEKVISGEGRLFMPGLTDCHMHTGQQLQFMKKADSVDAFPAPLWMKKDFRKALPWMLFRQSEKQTGCMTSGTEKET